MARVTVEDCVLKVPNRFDLVMLAAHRSRAISAGAALTLERDNDKNPVVALREIADETIGLMRTAIAESPRFPDLTLEVQDSARQRATRNVGHVIAELARAEGLYGRGAFAAERESLRAEIDALKGRGWFGSRAAEKPKPARRGTRAGGEGDAAAPPSVSAGGTRKSGASSSMRIASSSVASQRRR